LAANIVASGSDEDLAEVLRTIAESDSPTLQAAVLNGINNKVKVVRPLNDILKTLLNTLLKTDDDVVRGQAISLALMLSLEDSKALDVIRGKAAKDVVNPQLTTEDRLKAVALLSSSTDEDAIKSLISAWPTATPPVKTAILETFISREDRLPPLIKAMSTEAIQVSYLTPLQRNKLLERADNQQRSLLEALFSKAVDPDKEVVYARYLKGIQEGNGKIEHGRELFLQMCSSCHQVNDIGTEVGPDLKRAYKTSKETLLRDLLWPNEKITSGYEIFVVTTNSGRIYSGVLVSESANSLVL